MPAVAEASIRAARPDDAAEVARIQRDTWRTAYRTLLPAEVLDALDADVLGAAWLETIVDGPAVVRLALEGAAVVGFCVTGPAPVDEIAGADGSPPADASAVGLVGTLLVEPRWGRRGHGGRLISAAAGQMRAAGLRRAVAWVADGDVASRRFYHSIGWSPDGVTRILDAAGRPLRELRHSGPLDLDLIHEEQP